MRDSFTSSREDNLLIDPGAGIVLDAPPEARVSVRYVDSHPFMERLATHVVAGPDAAKVARGVHGTDYVCYEILSNEIGTLHLRRES